MASSLLPPTKKPTAGSFTRMYRVGPRRPPPPPPLKGAIAPGPTNPLDASDEPIAHDKSSATRRRARRTRMVAPPRRDARGSRGGSTTRGFGASGSGPGEWAPDAAFGRHRKRISFS
jgi:hypothetical protein